MCAAAKNYTGSCKGKRQSLGKCDRPRVDRGIISWVNAIARD
ncbi:hypothetical protein QUA20_09065 [Microcoleus sp. Pol7_A1]